MDHVVAKIKSRERKKIFKLLSDQRLFDNLSISIGACADYDPDHNLDEDSWFKIEQFSKKEYCNVFLKKNLTLKSTTIFQKPDFLILYIFALCRVKISIFRK